MQKACVFCTTLFLDKRQSNPTSGDSTQLIFDNSLGVNLVIRH